MMDFTVIDRIGNSHQVRGEASQSVMVAIKSAGLPIRAICGGQAICSTCHVYLDGTSFGGFTPPDEDEEDLLKDVDGYDPVRSRLSCQLPMAAVPAGFTAVLAPE